MWEEIIKGLLNAEEYKPIFKQILVLTKSYLKELKPYIRGFNDFQVEETVRCIDKYVNSGFSKEQAIELWIGNESAKKEIYGKFL